MTALIILSTVLASAFVIFLKIAENSKVFLHQKSEAWIEREYQQDQLRYSQKSKRLEGLVLKKQARAIRGSQCIEVLYTVETKSKTIIKQNRIVCPRQE